MLKRAEMGEGKRERSGIKSGAPLLPSMATARAARGDKMSFGGGGYPGNLKCSDEARLLSKLTSVSDVI